MLYDFRSPRGSHLHYFLTKVTDSLENCGTSFCETLHGFHRIFSVMTLPESIIKQKAKPSEISFILAMSKTGPRRIFQDLMYNFGTISEHISQLIQASFSSTQKCKKFKSRLLCRRGYPGHITEEGGTRHPGGSKRPWMHKVSYLSARMQKFY